MAPRKTTFFVDTDLVEQARRVLGTKTMTDTINEALREVIRVAGRARHFERLRARELAREADAPR
jgi:Arc/MetJ family transcription regulator